MRNLPIRIKLLIISIALMIPFTVTGYQLLMKTNENIIFTEQQIKGVIYEKPLLTLLNEIADYQIAQLRKQAGDSSAEQDIQDGVQTIDKVFAELAEIDKQVGADLDFTDEGMAKHGNAGIKFSDHLKKWEDIKSAKAYSSENYDSLLSALSLSIKQLGDSSGMILDPDLDSYYLVDASLASFPSMLSKLAQVKATTFQALNENGNVYPASDKAKFTKDLQMIGDVLLAKTNDDIGTALREDANFNGVSPSLKSALEPALKKYSDETQNLSKIMEDLLNGEKIEGAKFIEIADGLHDGAAELGQVALDELKKLLEIRIDNLKQGRMVTLEICAVSLLFAFAMFFVISGGITKPITRLTAAMKNLAEGDVDAEIPATENHDEIGNMARTVLVFKTNMKETAALKIAQEEQQKKAEHDKHELMQKMANNFETSVKTIVSGVAAAATELSQTARNMSATVSDSARLAGDATSAANNTNANIQSVASAAEELSAAVREISGQIQKTNSLVYQSTEKTEHADKLATALSAASGRVEEVMGMISGIAAQINLLALNSTIEASRAGEAGKGFAVVASEVKNLAGQTDKAINETQEVIEEMRSASAAITKALEEIKASVGNISSATTTVASAVEEQSATTNEIAQNMQTAAQGSQVVSNNLDNVSKSSAQAGDAAEQMLSASMELSQQAEKLNVQVDSFIAQIRAA